MGRLVPRRPAAAVGFAVVASSWLIYWLSGREFDAGHTDLYYLAEAFLRGETWIDRRLGTWDIIVIGDRVYVPFPPFPAIALMPLVAIIGAEAAAANDILVDATLASAIVGLAWWLLGRLGVERVPERLGLSLLLGFSSPIWWLVIRGGVWHTGQLIATILTLLLIAEWVGRSRPLVMGLLVGVAFLARPPLAFVSPVVALQFFAPLARIRAQVATMNLRSREFPWRAWSSLALGTAPALAFFLWYNAERFGSPLESGYGLALVPDWLQAQRAKGLFSLAHVPMNLDYLFLHLPRLIPEPPFLKPDGLGLSIFLTSPGLLLAVRAPWRERHARLFLLAAAAALIPTLLYYGGGWLQYGYRYALDSIPFVWALAALGAARRGSLPAWGWALIAVGIGVNALGVYWAYNL